MRDYALSFSRWEKGDPRTEARSGFVLARGCRKEQRSRSDDGVGSISRTHPTLTLRAPRSLSATGPSTTSWSPSPAAQGRISGLLRIPLRAALSQWERDFYSASSPIQRSSQSNTSECQRRLLRGWSTQWFSSGK